jgi:hypothetical protein
MLQGVRGTMNLCQKMANCCLASAWTGFDQ